MGLISIFVGMVIKGAPLSALNNPAAFFSRRLSIVRSLRIAASC